MSISCDDERTERRVLQHQGDGTFTIDGDTVDLETKTALRKPFQAGL